MAQALEIRIQMADKVRSPLLPSFLCPQGFAQGMSQESSAPKSLGAGNRLPYHRVTHGADAPWLDSCDKHRNEGGEGVLHSIAALLGPT
ncbi:hypothetical protein ATY78_08745 [Rhizobium sp. R635]|nr:hypothetical protein ATY78_08745 [Rhizobium sp. R635]